MRRRRASIEYPGPDTPTITDDDTQHAISDSQAILTASQQLLQHRPPRPLPHHLTGPSAPTNLKAQTFAAGVHGATGSADGQVGQVSRTVKGPPRRPGTS